MKFFSEPIWMDKVKVKTEKYSSKVSRKRASGACHIQPFLFNGKRS